MEELVFRHGYHQTILRWMNALPEEWVDRYPVIRIQYAFALSFYPRRQEYEAQVHRLQRLLQTLEAQPQADTRQIDELRCAVELQAAMSVALRDEGRRGGELAAAWLAGYFALWHPAVLANAPEIFRSHDRKLCKSFPSRRRIYYLHLRYALRLLTSPLQWQQ